MDMYDEGCFEGLEKKEVMNGTVEQRARAFQRTNSLGTDFSLPS